jgi:hypothetical protein
MERRRMTGEARVTYHEGEEKWAVDVEGAAWAASRHDKKARAEDAGLAVAKEFGSELTVRGKDGRIERRKRGRATKDVTTDIWTYREPGALGVDMAAGLDITGYSAEAIDGGIGKIDETTYDVGSSYVVVDTGPWILGRKVLLPAGVIGHIDPARKTVYVGRTKEQIKGCPEFDESTYRDEGYRTEVGSYYGDEARGFHTD